MYIIGLKKQIRQLGYELMLAEVSDSFCENFIEKRKLHDSLLEQLYKVEKRVF
jgi:hypothetical protein